MKYLLIAALILVPTMAVIAIHLLVQTWKGKNQIIQDKCEQIEELKAIRDVFVAQTKELRRELEEEQIRLKAMTQLYDEKCEQYDELYAITVANIFKPKDKKFLTLEVMRKAEEQSLKVANA